MLLHSAGMIITQNTGSFSFKSAWCRNRTDDSKNSTLMFESFLRQVFQPWIRDALWVQECERDRGNSVHSFTAENFPHFQHRGMSAIQATDSWVKTSTMNDLNDYLKAIVRLTESNKCPSCSNTAVSNWTLLLKLSKVLSVHWINDAVTVRGLEIKFGCFVTFSKHYLYIIYRSFFLKVLVGYSFNIFQMLLFVLELSEN